VKVLWTTLKSKVWTVPLYGTGFYCQCVLLFVICKENIQYLLFVYRCLYQLQLFIFFMFLCKLLYPFPKLSWFINSGNLKCIYSWMLAMWNTCGQTKGGEQNLTTELWVTIQGQWSSEAYKLKCKLCIVTYCMWDIIFIYHL